MIRRVVLGLGLKERVSCALGLGLPVRIFVLVLLCGMSRLGWRGGTLWCWCLSNLLDTVACLDGLVRTRTRLIERVFCIGGPR